MPKSLFDVEWIKIGLPVPLLEAFDRFCAERTESRSDVARRCLAKEVGYSGPSSTAVNEARRELARDELARQSIARRSSAQDSQGSAPSSVDAREIYRRVFKTEPPDSMNSDIRQEVEPDEKVEEEYESRPYDPVSHWEMVREAAGRGLMEMTQARELVEAMCASQGIAVPDEVKCDARWAAGNKINGLSDE